MLAERITPARPLLTQSPPHLMEILAVIPARFGAQRFPGKPLADLGGRPVIQWVYEAAAGCPHFDAVVVATDDERIASRVRELRRGRRADARRPSDGTDRVAEVAERRPRPTWSSTSRATSRSRAPRC